MIINALLLAFGLVGIPALICIHTELTCGGNKAPHNDNTPCMDHMCCGAAA